MSKLRYSEFVDRIDVDQVEEAIGFEPLYQQGDNDVGYCVFPQNHTHGDTTGKFAIHREKRVYNCFACGGGSLLSLVMELYDLDVDEATEWLYEFAHGDLRNDADFIDDFMAMFEDAERRAETLPYFNERVLDRFSDPIFNAFDHEKDDFWLETRNLYTEDVEPFGVRFLRNSLRPAPKVGRYADEEDYQGPSIIFPHYWQGRLVGWQQRWLEAEADRPDWLPKYTNTSDFPKDSTIYNYDNALKSSESVIVVESVPTVIYLASKGLTAVATFGSSVNPPQLRLLRRFSQGVILAPDNDKAGLKWLSANTNYLKRFIPIQHLPPVKGSGADLNDLIEPGKLEEHLTLAYRPELEF